MESSHKKYDEKTNEVYKKWLGLSNFFAEKIEPTTLPNALQNFEQLISVLPSISGLRVIELGCGSGIFCKSILDSYSSLIDEYTLVDISDVMVDIAKKRLEDHIANGKCKLNFHVLSIDDLHSIPSGAYDLAISNYCIHLTAYPHKAFLEAKRVLKPEGYLTASVLGNYRNSQRFRTMVESAEEMGLFDPQPHVLEQFQFGSEDLLSQAGEKAGFKLIYSHVFYDLAPVGDNFGYEVIRNHRPLLNSKMTEDEAKKIGELYEQKLKSETGESRTMKTMGVYAIFKKVEH